jgi:hypothetical protein
MKKILITVLALLVLFTVSKAKKLELSIQGGKAFSNDEQVALSLLDSYTLVHFQNGLTLGVTGAIHLSKNFLLEGEFFYYRKPFSRLYVAYLCMQNDIPMQCFKNIYSFNGSAFNLNALLVYEFKLKFKRLIPYLVFGAGLMNTRISSYENPDGHQSLDSGSGMNINIGHGGGFKYLLGKASGIRFDCRYINVFSSETDAREHDRVSYSILRLTAGYFITI